MDSGKGEPMRITADILYGLLSEKYRISRYGKGISSRELALPVLFEPGTAIEAGRIYIARTGDLPNRPPEKCVFVCCGTKPPNVWNSWPCDVIHIVDPRVSLIGVFNTLLALIDQLVTWQSHMQQLAISGADVREMIEESIPVFENTITVSDYELRILGHCEPDKSLPDRPIRMDEREPRVPSAYVSATKDFGIALQQKRTPYITEEAVNPDEGIEGVNSYCINLFDGDTYMGTCALKEEGHPFRSYDFELFQQFASFVRDCLGVQSRSMGNQLISARTVFEQILRGYPVSMRDMEQAVRLIEAGLGGVSADECKWCCTVIQNAHRDRGLPEEYLCKSVEAIPPHTAAFIFEGSIVSFTLIGKDEHRVTAICAPLQAYLEDMGFKAGISRTFTDPFHARTFYHQGLTALEMGMEIEPGRLWYLFGDYVLDYLLQNCCGEFGAEAIVAPELVRLYHSSASGPEYVQTLRTFLDTGCHTTQTAEELFLHRSTLIKRLDRIREIVDLDTPKRRLYLQICLHLPDIEQMLEKGVDVGGLD